MFGKNGSIDKRFTQAKCSREKWNQYTLLTYRVLALSGAADVAGVVSSDDAGSVLVGTRDDGAGWRDSCCEVNTIRARNSKANLGWRRHS